MLPLCRAIINTEEEKGLPKHLGKKKLKECRLKMRLQDEYTWVCPANHRRRNDKWEMRSFSIFYLENKKGSV